MVSTISSAGNFNMASQQLFNHAPAAPANKKFMEERQAFQGFAAGTFYQTMIKALRSTERETKYFNGGRAEKIFRSEFDQRVASSMAEEHGDQFTGPLFEQYLSNSRHAMKKAALSK